VAAATTGTPAVTSTVKYYAFDINNGSTDPGLVAVPGTSPAEFAQGDELILNDQVTTTHLVKGGSLTVQGAVFFKSQEPKPPRLRLPAGLAASAAPPARSACRSPRTTRSLPLR
jgi:hypothetical protein